MVIRYELKSSRDGSIPSQAWLADRAKKRIIERRYREKNRAAINERSRIRWAKDPEKSRAAQRRHYWKYKQKCDSKSRAYQYKSRYALTVELRDELFRQNDGKCMICNVNVSEHIDHDHTTGKIRGTLCRGCNHGLGNFCDNPQLLIAAAKYLLGKEAA